MDVAAIIRRAGGRVHTENDNSAMDPRFRLQIEPKISILVWRFRVQFPTENADRITDMVEKELKIQVPNEMPTETQIQIRKELRELILTQCKK